MNELSILNNFVIGRFNQDTLVNTITIVPTLDVDGNKENIFPLVNVDFIENDIQTDAFVATYKITILQQREVKPIKTNSKLLNDSNYLDNMNETNSIAAKFINYLRWKNNDLNIEIQNLSTLRPLKNWGKGGCDGVQFDIDLSIYNRGSVE